MARALLVALLLSCAAASVVAFVSRTPASVRTPANVSFGEGADDGGFPDAVVARHGAYRGPLYLAFALGAIVEVAVLLLLRGRPIGQLVGWFERVPGGWPVRAALVTGSIALITWLVALPLGFVRGYAIQKAWGISTQDVAGWLADQGKGLGISVVIAAIAAVAFFGIVRVQPRLWWVSGAAGFTALTALFVFLFPVVIAPLFNRFTPLDDSNLVTRIRSLAAEAGVEVGDVLVADASRRSIAENAYVAGLGPTKQVVLYDTLLAAGDDETLFVVAHELGHQKEGHVLKGVWISAVGFVIGFGALAWIVGRTGFVRWMGADSLTDVRVIPALMLFGLVAGLLLLPAQNAVSRSFEATADRIAFDLIADPDPAIRGFQRLALTNLADLRPPRIAVWLLFSHPPIPERIAAAQAQIGAKP